MLSISRFNKLYQLLPAGLLAVAAFFAPGKSHAQLCTLTSGGATYTIPAASHYDNSQTVNLTGFGTGDLLFEDGWWFRVSGDTQESFFPAPTTTTCAGSSGTITWADVNTRGLFSASNTLTINSAAAGTGELVLTMAITNLSAVNPLTITVFHGADFDVNGTAGTDNATLLTANSRIRITDTTANAAEYGGLNPAANAFLVRPFAAATDVFGLLGDTLVTNFDNSGLPGTSFDFTGAYQWDLVIPPGGTASVSAFIYGNTTLPALSPEIAVTGNGNNIGDGDITPSTTDHTDFDTVPAVGGTLARTFTINNTGGGPLTVGTVTVGGTHSGDFTVTSQPTSPVAAAGSTTFQVTFDPSAVGLRQASLSFSTDDTDENPFNFDIQGTGIASPPTISDVANQVINEDANTGALAVTVGDVETAAAALVLTGSSDNTALVPNANIVLGGSGANRTVTITPTADVSGTATVTLTVTDGDLNTANDTILVTVDPVNDLPSFTIGGNRNHPAGTNTAQSFADGATAIADGDADFTQALTFNVSNNNNALFSVQPAIDAAGTLTYTPTGTVGSATVTVTLTDDATAGGAALTTTSQTFQIAVAAALPTISDVPDQPINEDGNTGPIAFTVGDVETPAASLTVTGSSSNTALVPNANIVFGGSGASRTVTITPAANMTGSATITLTVTDADLNSASDTLALTVAAVNDLPSFTIGANRVHPAGTSTPQVFSDGATAINDGDLDAAQGLTFNVSNDNNALFTTPPTIDGVGTLTYTPTGTPGTAIVTVSLTDDANAGGPALTSAPQTFTISVVAAGQNVSVPTLSAWGLLLLVAVFGWFGIRRSQTA